MERILRLTAAADPTAAAKLLGTPESPRHVGILAIVGDRGLAGSYNSGVLRATERLVAEHRAQRRRGDGVVGGQEGPALLPLPRHRRRRASFVGFADRPEFADARARRRRRGRTVRGRRDRPGRSWCRPGSSRPGPSGSSTLQLLPAARCPRRRRGGGRDADEADARGLHRVRARAREAAARAGAAGPGGGDLRRPARGRGRRSSRPSSGPWRPPPTTRTSSSAP